MMDVQMTKKVAPNGLPTWRSRCWSANVRSPLSFCCCKMKSPKVDGEEYGVFDDKTSDVEAFLAFWRELFKRKS